MKTLYGEDSRYTVDALSLLQDVTKTIKPIMKQYADKGYSIRDISHVAQAAIGDFENEHILIGQAKNFRKNRENKSNIGLGVIPEMHNKKES